MSDEELRKLLDDQPIAFGLRAQGKLESVAKMVADGKSWPEIGTAIGWDGETARKHYEREIQRVATRPLQVIECQVPDGIGEHDELAQIVDATGNSLVEIWNPKDDDLANLRLLALAPEALALATAPLWLVWSNYHQAWWGPNRSQYYSNISAAGRYTLEEAMDICKARGVERGEGVNPPEMIQPSPEWLDARAAIIAKLKG